MNQERIEEAIEGNDHLGEYSWTQIRTRIQYERKLKKVGLKYIFIQISYMFKLISLFDKQY